MWRCPPTSGPARAWDAGEDGRLLLDPLCASAPDLLTSGGNLLLVHSEIAGTDRSLDVYALAGCSLMSLPGNRFRLVRCCRPGRRGSSAPVRLEAGRRDEQLVAILAHKP